MRELAPGVIMSLKYVFGRVGPGSPKEFGSNPNLLPRNADGSGVIPGEG